MDAEAASSAQQPSKRKAGGRPFRAGQSGNPAGRNAETKHVRELAKRYTEEAVLTLAEIMRNKDEGGRSRAAAADALLNRAWGKPSQPVDGDGEGSPVQHVLRVVWGSDG